jgi:methylated-DNA-[protein]-cysteine S-methyltransferase
MQDAFITYYQSPVGLLKIAGTNQFISEVTFVDEPENITAATDNNLLPPMAIQAVEQLIEYFHGNRRSFELPISQEGTAFQQKVWAELILVKPSATWNCRTGWATPR